MKLAGILSLTLAIAAVLFVGTAGSLSAQTPSDSCGEVLTGDGSISGQWAEGCQKEGWPARPRPHPSSDGTMGGDGGGSPLYIKKGLRVGHRVMTWSEDLSTIAAGIAVVLAAASFWVAYMAYRIAALQALPHPDIGWTARSTGQRSLDFQITRTSGNADWAVQSASIRGNWRRRRHLARGVLEGEETFEGDTVKFYATTGPWQRCIIFDPPVAGGGIVLHPDAPDCEVKLKLTLRTLPSPKVVRRIKLKRLQPQTKPADCSAHPGSRHGPE